MTTRIYQHAALFLAFIGLLATPALAQKLSPGDFRMDPPHWYSGLKETQFQLLIHAEHMTSEVLFEVASKGVILDSAVTVSNPHYRFLYLTLLPDYSGDVIKLRYRQGRKWQEVCYPIQNLPTTPDHIDALNTSDFMYLLMPDRFANGDYDNDVVEGMNETKLNRAWMYDRHGGDLQGVMDRLEYLQDLGVTALWLNPVLENDEPKTSYHGYATTDSYAIDPRYGDVELYCALGDSLRTRGMKLVKDVIYNHWGDQHWIVLDPPDGTWVNAWPEFTRTSHRPYTLFDPYGSKYDKDVMTDGWFDHHMPDINQRNPLLADYLIQNTLWWIAEAGLDALRIDTYYYPDQEFMAKLVARVRQEFPNCFVFGECWIRDPVALNWVSQRVSYRDLPDTRLNGITDFPLYFSTLDALNRETGWESGAIQWYITLANDVLLDEQPDHVLFLDNHDLSRYYSMVGEDFDKYQVGLVFLMTTRGIPMIYYGTEILMTNFCDPDGKVRSDFPGGWNEDSVSKFQEAGRTSEEQAAFEFVKELAWWRQTQQWLGDSQLMHFIPQNGVYVYFRYDALGNKAMVALNPQNKEVELSLEPYSEMLPDDADLGLLMSNGAKIEAGGTVSLPGKSYAQIRVF